MKTHHILLIILTIALIILCPLAVIWAINVLFPAAAVSYGLAEWAAVVVLIEAFTPRTGPNKT